MNSAVLEEVLSRTSLEEDQRLSASLRRLGQAGTLAGRSLSVCPQCGIGEPHFLSQSELARRWLTTPRTLMRWRRNGVGPAWLRLGGRVLYPISDVVAHERAHLRRPQP